MLTCDYGRGLAGAEHCPDGHYPYAAPILSCISCTINASSRHRPLLENSPAEAVSHFSFSKNSPPSFFRCCAFFALSKYRTRVLWDAPFPALDTKHRTADLTRFFAFLPSYDRENRRETNELP